MMSRLARRKGFLIVEVLIVIMILAVAFTAFLGGMAQVLKVSSKSSRMTDAISRYDSLLFEIENGLRPDLAGYGGHGELGEGYRYQIDSKAGREFSSLLKSRFSWKEGKEFLELELLASKAPTQ